MRRQCWRCGETSNWNHGCPHCHSPLGPHIDQLSFYDKLDDDMGKACNVHRLDEIMEALKIWHGGRVPWNPDWETII